MSYTKIVILLNTFLDSSTFLFRHHKRVQQPSEKMKVAQSSVHSKQHTRQNRRMMTAAEKKYAGLAASLWFRFPDT